MLDQRYQPLQPDIERLIQLPEGSMGRVYAELIRGLNYDPEFSGRAQSLARPNGSPSRSGLIQSLSKGLATACV